MRAICRWLAPLLLALSGCGTVSAQDQPERVYAVTYTVTPLPATRSARVELRLSQNRALLRELSMSAPSAPGSRFSDFEADGDLDIDGDRVTWLPPAAGGTVRWTVKVAHRRYGEAYDAWMGDEWALFRASDIIPPASTRTLKGARSQTALQFDLPQGWSSVTEYYGRQ
ncbi:MAG: hypothetical protein U5K76_05990 [Woeseiaceae bacterium]|nr:hypothetical protein [Woeseiaceae bacterium]